MYNKLVPEVPSVPQTGDNPWMPAVFGVMAVMSALAGGALIFLRHTDKNRKVDEDQHIE